MARKAKIYTYTVVTSAAEAFKDKVPYLIAVLEDETGRFTSFVEGYKEGVEVKIGMEVEAVQAGDGAGNAVYRLA